MCTFNPTIANSNLSKVVTLNNLIFVGACSVSTQNGEFYFIKLHSKTNVPFAINNLKISKALFELIKNQNNISCNAIFKVINGKTYLIELDLLPIITIEDIKNKLYNMINNKLN